MTDHTADRAAKQDSVEKESARTLLDQLLIDSRLYTKSKDYKELLDFAVRLPNVATFNAMLLQIQKPGLKYAASAYDWLSRFGRRPKEGARPLLILWPFGPVALVYDEMDTEGEPLPEDVASFFAHGEITEAKLNVFRTILKVRNVDWRWVDAGDLNAGSIRVVHRASDKDGVTLYRIHVNRNHGHDTQFALDPIRWTSFQRGNTMATMADSKARRTRRSFTDAYKTGAVRLVLDEGNTVAAAARDLGLTESSLRNWVEQARADRTKGKTGLTTEERTELAALRKDNRELRMERDILKKAAAFFARNQA